MRWVYAEGYMNEGCVLSASIFFDAVSASEKVFTLYGTGAYVDDSNSLTFGDATFGDAVFGGDPSGVDVILNKFRVRLDCPILS